MMVTRRAALAACSSSVLAGLGLLAAPVVAELSSAAAAEGSISEIEAVYDAMSDEARGENLRQAHAWNDRLRGIDPGFEPWGYDEQLTYHDEPSTMMAWVEVPKVGSHLPVYHHATDAVLMAGVGHVETTSLPVGGEGTLCALSGHSGMPNARMFDDIRELEEGDVFVVWTLKEPYAYRVCDVSVVEPQDTWVLDPQPGRDLCALVTCTPINVNTHRLVVTGERCAYEPEAEEMEPAVASVANRRTVPLIAASSACVAVLAALGTGALLRRGERRRADGTSQAQGWDPGKEVPR